MKCPSCGCLESKVIDSRTCDEGAKIRRRRECLACKQRFTTFETLECTPLVVLKKDNTREKFEKNKLLNGFIKACEKRPVPLEKLEKTVDDIEKKLRSKMNKEVPSTIIGEYAMDDLRKLDKVAYIRFASVYRQFDDVETFSRELEMLKKASIIKGSEVLK